MQKLHLRSDILGLRSYFGLQDSGPISRYDLQWVNVWSKGLLVSATTHTNVENMYRNSLNVWYGIAVQRLFLRPELRQDEYGI